MVTRRFSTPFNPVTYTARGTYLGIIQGLEETLRRWGEIDPVTALRLPAFFLEAMDAQVRHGIPLLLPSSVADVADENLALASAAADVMQRVEDDGYDPERIILELRIAMRPEIEAGIAQFKRQYQTGRLHAMGG
ncbi:MAG: hypothetical protein DIJKHBIC_02292 [Thermoanaerobaculia bacterium]|nr:hypothetical protein [Thermoanaerobaculia bacterium]